MKSTTKSALSPYECLICGCRITWDECEERTCEECQSEDDEDFDFDSEIEKIASK